MDLPVDAPHLAVRGDVHARIGALRTSLDALHDRAGDQIDSQLTRGVASPGDAATVERLGPGSQLLARAQYAPFLRQHDQLGSARCGVANQTVGRLEVAVGVLVALSWTAPARILTSLTS